MTHGYNPALTPSTTSEGWRGIRASIPVLLGMIPFALVLGAQAAHKELSPLEVALMTGLDFGGGSEFAALEVWTTPPNLLLITAITLLVNSRHLLMGATFAPYLAHLPLKRALPALFLMCDESWALALDDARRRKSEQVSLKYFVGLAASLWVTWTLFSTLGGLLAPSLGDLRHYGLDMAFAAVFLVLLRGMWSSLKAAAPWFVSLLTAALFAKMLPGHGYVVAGPVAGLVWVYLWAE